MVEKTEVFFYQIWRKKMKNKMKLLSIVLAAFTIFTPYSNNTPKSQKTESIILSKPLMKKVSSPKSRIYQQISPKNFIFIILLYLTSSPHSQIFKPFLRISFIASLPEVRHRFIMMNIAIF